MVHERHNHKNLWGRSRERTAPFSALPASRSALNAGAALLCSAGNCSPANGKMSFLSARWVLWAWPGFHRNLRRKRPRCRTNFDTKLQIATLNLCGGLFVIFRRRSDETYFLGTGAGEGYPGLWCRCPHWASMRAGTTEGKQLARSSMNDCCWTSGRPV